MRTFFKTVAVVTVFSVCEKFLGFLYRIFLSRTIGAEGMGMYQIALSVFSLLLTFCCSGTPITVSRLMTKYKAEGRKDKVQKVISAGLLSVLSTAIPICLIFFIFRKPLSFIFSDALVMNLFLIILPGLIFTSVYAVLRGVFWGNKDFLPYSVIELLEELCMIVVGIVLICCSNSVYQGTVGASVAVLVSYIFSFTLATIVFFVRKNKICNPKTQLKPLFKSSAPITLMRTANSLTISLVSVILPLRLISAGWTNAAAMSAFGSAAGQAIPLLFIPTTLIGSFTLVLIPELSENYYRKKYFYLKRDIEKSLKITALISCLFIPIFTVCGQEIGILVFNSHECGTYLTASAFLMLFMSISNITTSMLNSIGLEKKTLLFFIISSVFMLISIWFLPAVIGVYSLLVGFSFIFCLTSILNIVLLYKKCPEKPACVKGIVTSFLLAIPTAILGLFLKKMLLSPLGSVLTLFICAFVMGAFYCLLAVAFGLVDFRVVVRFIKSNSKKKPKIKKTKAN